MTISLIAALDNESAIGKGGVMPWHLPDELKHFKAMTLGKPVLMGYDTAVSIGKLLPGRRNLVLTREHDAPYAEQITVRSLDEAQVMAGGEELMVIGGGKVFREALPYAQHLYLTWVDATFPGADVFFPEVDFTHWVETSRTHHARDERHPYAFDIVSYVRE